MKTGEPSSSIKSAPACRQKQITVTSSGGAEANHYFFFFVKSGRYQENGQESRELTVRQHILPKQREI